MSESFKRESRIRAGDEIRSLPVDIHKGLITHQPFFRHSKLWDMAVFAMSLGLRVMDILADDSPKAIHKTAQNRLGWNTDPPELIEMRQQFCRATGMDEQAARLALEFYGAEMARKTAYTAFEDGADTNARPIRRQAG